MATDFADIFTLSITLRDVLMNLLVALFCGTIISLLYRFTYKGLNYSASFAVSMIMLTMITSVVIMVIGNNLARAFGMVGAMSIIRFRTAVKDTSDIMFIFFALTIGLASGVKLYSIAIFGTFFISLVYFIMMKVNFSLPQNREFLMQIITQGENLPDNPFAEILQKYCKRYKLVNIKTLGEEHNEMMEFSYYINMKNEEKGNEFVTTIKKQDWVKHANLFFDETS